MNKMFLSLLCASVVSMGATAVYAQPAEEGMLPPPPPAHEMPHKVRKDMADKFAKDLGLTEEQKAQADKIRKDGREKMEPLMKEMKNLREKMDKLREDNMKDFEKILTPEQKDKLDKIKAEHKKKFEEGRKKRKMMKKHKGPRPGPEPRD